MDQLEQARLGAVVVYYNPSAENLESTINNLAVVDYIVVVVNGPWEDRYETIAKHDRVRVLPLGRNTGIATATNKGIDCLREIGSFSHFVLLDQDTSLPGNYKDLLQLEAALLAKGIAPGVVSPCYFNPRTKLTSACMVFKKFRFERFIPSQELEECTCLIASGSLIRAEVLAKAGRMKDDFFIDYVDNEFCLRLYSLGYRNFVAGSIKMAHELGEQAPRRIMGMNIKPTNHSPLRKYYITRNRLVVLSKYFHLFPSLFMFETMAMSLDCFRVLFFEKRRMIKFRMIFSGFRDFLLGRMGEKPS